MGLAFSEIGKTRAKLAPIKLQQPQIDVISNTFKTQIESLGLTVKNGAVVEMPNKIAKTTGSDINAIQSLYDDFLKFKQSPTIENAYALRTNFDAKIKFGQSARDVSNAVDPLSRSVRSAIAGESAKVIGKENAVELKKYSDFMDAYGDLKAFTDRSAGSEYLLRLVLSGRGREARDLVDTIKVHTGIDLMNDATAMKIAVERFANESQQNLFKQEVTRAGYDIAGMFEKGPVGMIGTVAQRLAEYGIDAENVIKATAAGTGGYILMTYYGEDGLTPAGFAVMAAMPDNARKQAIKQAQDIAKTTGKNVDDLAKYIDKAPDIDNPSFNKGATPQTTALLESKNGYIYHGTNESVLDNIKKEGLKPGRRGQLSVSTTEDYAKTFAREGVTPAGKTKSVLLRVKADALKGKTTTKRLDGKERPVPDQQNELLTKETIAPENLEIFTDGKWQSLISKSLALLSEAKKYKSAEEYVKAQGMPVYHGTKANFTEFKPSSSGEIGKGVYFYDSKSKASNHVGDGGRVVEAYVNGKLATMDEFRAVREELGDASWTNSDTINELVRRGYVGIVRPEGNSTVYNIFDPKNIKTKESLEKIWKQANQ